MPDKPESTPATDLVKTLARLFHEPRVDDLSQEEIDAEIKRAGIDVSRMQGRLSEALEIAKNRLKLHMAGARRTVLLRKLAEFAEALPMQRDPREKVRQLLESILGGTPQAAVQFRKLEETKDADLVSLVEDLQFLEEIEEHDDEHGAS